MILTIYAKAHEKDGKKWTKYSTKRKNVWYTVHYVHDCRTPKIYTIDNSKVCFINLNDSTKYDLKTDAKGYKHIYVTDFTDLTADELKQYGGAERQRIADYKATKNAEKMEFEADDDDPPVPITDNTQPPPLPVSDEDMPF